MPKLPVIDVSALAGSADASAAAKAAAARELDAAARAYGFFYVSGHGVDAALVARLATET